MRRLRAVSLGVNADIAEQTFELEAEEDGEMLPAALAVPAGTTVSGEMGRVVFAALSRGRD